MKLSSKPESFAGPDAYYEAAYLILAESKRFSVAAKTPTLLLPQEKASKWRQKYFELADERVKAGLPTAYLFSLPETLEKLREIKTAALLRETLDSWREFVSLKSFDLRYVPHSNFKSVVFSDKHLALSVKDSVTGKSAAAIVKPIGAARGLVSDFKVLENAAKRVDEAYIGELARLLAK